MAGRMGSGTIKKIAGVVLQLGITAAALFFVFHDPLKRTRMLEACRHADARWLGCGLAVYGGVEALALVRWQILLRIQGFRLSWRRATAILFVSEFFLTFTPGLVGGDAMRIFYLVKNQPEKKVDAFTAVAMDRLMGLLALISFATVIVGSRYAWLSQSVASAHLVKVVLIILGFGVGTLALSVTLATAGWPKSWPVPASVEKIAGACRQFSRARSRTGIAFATTLLSHACYYTSFCCAARALVGPTGPTFGSVFSIMPIENTLTALPISFAGIGLRESLFQTLLHDLAGVAPAVGALIGSAGFGMKMLWSLPGLFVFFTLRLAERKRVPTVAPATAGNPPTQPA